MVWLNDNVRVTQATNIAKEVPYLRERVTTLGNMVEGLKAQLEQKNIEERYLLKNELDWERKYVNSSTSNWKCGHWK